MIILAVDTSGEVGSLALLRDDAILAQRAMCSPNGFAHLLFEELTLLLESSGVRLTDVDVYAAASGPGSFTGVRIALATVKGLSEGEGKPAVAVSNLRAMSLFGTQPKRAVILDAHRGEVYAAVYDDGSELFSAETVQKPGTWFNSLTEPVDEVISFGNFEAPADLGLRHTVAPRELAAAIAWCAARDCRAGKGTDPAALDANYVRRPDAMLNPQKS